MKTLNICNIYTGAWCLYLLQGAIFDRGGMIGRILILLILVVSLYYFVSNLFRANQPEYLKALNILVLFFTVYGLVSIIFGIKAMTEFGTVKGGDDFLKQYYSSLLPIYAYYSFARDGLMKNQWFYKWSWVFFIVAIMAFYARRNDMLLEAYGLQTEFTNNLGYLFVSLIPITALVSEKKYYHWILWIIVLLFSLLSFKRGAILISSVSFLFYYFFSSGDRIKKNNRNTAILILSFIAIYFAVQYLLQNSDYFRFRIERTAEGSMSERDVIYAAAWKTFINSDFLHKVYGYGANMTGSLLGNGAHNDWLELLVNHGLLGVFFFLYYWSSLYKTWRKSSNNGNIKIAIGLFLIVTFIRTFFSFSIGDMRFFSASVIGYCLTNIIPKKAK